MSSAPSPRPTKLIILCCHAIYIGPSITLSSPPPNDTTTDPKNWLLAPFQTQEVPTFIAHLHAALQELQQDEQAILVISGGATKKESTRLSEARSYYNLLSYLSHAELDRGLKERILLEERATDSFQNLLFSLLVFQDNFSYSPKEVIVVTHAFKTRRLLNGHARTLRLAEAGVKVDVKGLDPLHWPDGPCEESEMAEKGEENARKQWQEDHWGRGEILGEKRRKRGWEDKMAEGMHEIVLWDGGEIRVEPYPGILPWEKDI